ncbi:hypothetical protein ANCCEY_03213 [Ancylostoma ceylanicum]|uniref:Mitochondrial 2-oxoglutarate/malate carrier protein n=1 Tax=Ancylostoma ceylanicum TaxID=53326 RepID=A0A0D6M0U1_9BILA|nr:hypothetical protein ANCCEY_03213 [Ancylostoma ceylanicum]
MTAAAIVQPLDLVKNRMQLSGKSGIGAGACGALVGTPADLALIRMTGDGHLPPEQRRNYKNVIEALFRIAKEEGIFTWFRGCSPTVIRAMVVNAAQLATYSHAKELILGTKKVKDASMISGLATTIASMPVDIIKTRIQAMKVIDGVPEYSGLTDIVVKLLRKEGIFAFWKGFTPYYMRLGPHTVLTFIFLEQFNRAYIRNFVKKPAEKKDKDKK